jgi:hypothetical protein
VAGRWFSRGTPVSSTNKTDRRDMTEILLKVALNTINKQKHKKNLIKLNLCMKKHWIVLYEVIIICVD